MKGTDIYKELAARIFKISVDEVTKEQRKAAKSICWITSMLK
jgi:DNA polymerase I-like protein with 3'-5' exonuclease and polymerase domains